MALNTKEELLDGAVLYMKIYFLGMPALAIYNFGNAILSAAGDTRRPLLYLSIVGGVNVVLNLFFVIVCRMDGISVIMSLVLLLFGRQFLSLFTPDAAVIEAGMQRLGIMGFSYLVSAFMDCTIAASRGLGKSIPPTFIVIMGSCVFRLIWVYTIFEYFKTIPSLYLLYVCS